MNRTVVHIVHWKMSGIYDVARELQIYGTQTGDKHEICVIRLNKSRRDFFLSFITLFRLLKRVMTEKNVIFHAHSFLPFLFLFFSRSKYLAITLHNAYPFLLDQSARSKLKCAIIRKLCQWRTPAASAVGKEAARYLKAGTGVQALVIPNGLSSQKYEFSLPDSLKILGTAGRLDEQKNYEELVLGVSLIKDLDFTLLIAGEGIKRRILEEQILNLGLSEKVKLIGFVTNMKEFYTRLDGFICSSLYEGCNLVAAEAVFSGKPLISTKVGIASDFEELQVIHIDKNAASIAEGIEKWLTLSKEESNNQALHNKEALRAVLDISKTYLIYKTSIWKF